MVPVFSFGPSSENFSGIYENTQIFYKLKESIK
jgi:alkaline phosphatase